MSESPPCSPFKNIAIKSPKKTKCREDKKSADKSVHTEGLFGDEAKPEPVKNGIIVKVKLSDAEKTAYALIHKANGGVGGNGSNGAIYGEVTKGSLHWVIKKMIEKCELDDQSLIIDIGAGLGKPNFHFAQYPGCRLSIGIELEELRWQLSMIISKAIHSHKNASGKEPLQKHVHLMHGDIHSATTLDPFTHIYQYDIGFPKTLHESIAEKFNTSQSANYLMSYYPEHIIQRHGYSVKQIDSLSTAMCGSGEGHTCYFYKRTNKLPVANTNKKAKLLTLEPRPTHPNDPVEPRVVPCDPVFFETCRLAAALDPSELKVFVDKQVSDFMNAPRPKRGESNKRELE